MDNSKFSIALYMKEILTQKTYKEYPYISRYSVFPYYYNRLDDKYVYGLTSHLKKDASFVSHTVKQGDTLDTLSLYYYNSPLYFWAIADFNDIRDPYKELKEGTLLKIPTFNDIEFEL